jgi:valyl-tRNA synthetase
VEDLGLSVDWSMTYATIGKRAQRVSQLAFLHLLRAARVSGRSADAVGHRLQTAVAQAELEDREMPARTTASASARPIGASSRSTRRARADPACVALVAHPDDERYSRCSARGRDAAVRRRGAGQAHPLADPEKGSGIAMICTFGDITDVTWWRELSCRCARSSSRTARCATCVGRAGLGVGRSPRARSALRRAAGLSAAKARAKIVEQLRESGDLVGEPRSDYSRREVYENGRSATRNHTRAAQWFNQDASRLPRRAAGPRAGNCSASAVHACALRKLDERLDGDWCISRQRFFGVAVFRCGIPLVANGRPQYARPITPSEINYRWTSVD